MDTTKQFITTLMSAISNCSLYSPGHAAVEEFGRRSLVILENIFRETESLEIMCIEDNLVINKVPAKGLGLQGSNLRKRLQRKGLSLVEFSKGVTLGELRDFIASILEKSEHPTTFPHIRMGVLDIRQKGVDAGRELDDSESLAQLLDLVKDIWRDIASRKELSVSKVNKVTENLVSACCGKTAIDKLLSFAKSREEYTYMHATNVSILSVFQMETLGMRERSFLHDVGISGLLHDVGKFFISGEILGKKGALSEEEWEMIKLHPLYGARYLSAIAGIPRLASVVAFQHHLGYNGKGYPKFRTSFSKQHICSQVVALADFFDALRSNRPYRKGMEIVEVLCLMKKEAARAFNPFLLENFIRRMHAALAETQ